MERVYEGMSIQEVTEFLFLEDHPEPADLIFVFGGRHRERAVRAAELYRAGLAPFILFTGGDKRGTGRAESAVLAEVAQGEGVPEEHLLTEERSANTEENVLYGRELLRQVDRLAAVHRALLISAPYHLRRAKATFLRHFPGVRALAIPDGRTDVNRANWWQTEEGRRIVFRELEKVRDQARQGKL